MKKIISLLAIAFCLNNAVQAQVDSNRVTTDTGMLDHNKTNNNKTKPNQDSVNLKKKVPQKTHASAMGRDSSAVTQKMNNKNLRKEKSTNSNPNP